MNNHKERIAHKEKKAVISIQILVVVSTQWGGLVWESRNKMIKGRLHALHSQGALTPYKNERKRLLFKLAFV